MPRTGFGLPVIVSSLETGQVGNTLKQPVSCNGWQNTGKPTTEVPGEEASPLPSLEK